MFHCGASLTLRLISSQEEQGVAASFWDVSPLLCSPSLRRMCRNAQHNADGAGTALPTVPPSVNSHSIWQGKTRASGRHVPPRFHSEARRRRRQRAEPPLPLEGGAAIGRLKRTGKALVISAQAAILSAVGGIRLARLKLGAFLPPCSSGPAVFGASGSSVAGGAMANNCPVVGAGNCHPPPHQQPPPQHQQAAPPPNPQAGAVLSPPLPLQSAGPKPAASGKQGNVLPLWGNEKTMNLNPMILTNILSSPYFKVQLYELKTYHEVVDEIYFKVTHIEPWEKGSRKTAGQTGMCGGVRGVGTGGIVSTAFCLLYKLFTLKLTRKQVMGLITHTDSPYIRALGFMYIRYTQPPTDLWDWFESFLDDEEDLDVKAGGGCVMTIGEMLRSFLTKLEWFSTLFPRIPVPVQKNIDLQIKARPRKIKKDGKEGVEEVERHAERRRSRSPRRSLSPRRSPRRSRSRSRHREGRGSSSFDRELERERERQRLEREAKERERERRRSRSSDRALERKRSRSRERHRSRSRDRKGDRRDREREREKENERSRRKERDYDKDRAVERDRERSRERDRSREKSKDRKSKSEIDERRHKDEKDERKHRDEKRDSKKEKKHSRSRSRDRKHRSRSVSRNAGKHSRSRSKEKSSKHKSESKEKSNKRSRSRSRGRTDSSEKTRKRDHSPSKERSRKRSKSKERSHKHDHSDKDHSDKHDHQRSQSTEREIQEKQSKNKDETV